MDSADMNLASGIAAFEAKEFRRSLQLLQPLAENAIYHGIEPAEEGGFIHIVGQSDDKEIVVRIINSLPNGDGRSVRASNKMAQENVEQRLRAFFGKGSSLEVSSGDGEYAVQLRFPYVKEHP